MRYPASKINRLVLLLLVLRSLTGTAIAQTGPDGAPDPVHIKTSKTEPQGKTSQKEARRPEIELRVTPRTINVGDPITYELTISHDKQQEITLSDKLNFAPFELLDKAFSSELLKDQVTLRQSYKFKLSIYKLGRFVIPPVKIRYGTDDKEQTLQTKSVDIEVKSLTLSAVKLELKQIQGPIEVVQKDYLLLILFIVVCGTLLIAAVAITIYSQIKKRRLANMKVVIPKRPAHEIAFEKLNQILTDRLIEKNLYKEFYVRASESIRTYFGDRYDFDSVELTTTELLDKLSEIQVENVRLETIRDYLNDTDIVKFAKFVPTPEDAKRILALAFEMVEKTLKPETPLKTQGPVEPPMADVSRTQADKPPEAPPSDLGSR